MNSHAYISGGKCNWFFFGGGGGGGGRGSSHDLVGAPELGLCSMFSNLLPCYSIAFDMAPIQRLFLNAGIHSCSFLNYNLIGNLRDIAPPYITLNFPPGRY